MLVLLLGPKGSGKSHIGRLLEQRLDVHFVDVEPLWMTYHAECGAAGLGRIASRDQSRQIPMDVEDIRKVYTLSACAAVETQRWCCRTMRCPRPRSCRRSHARSLPVA